MRTAWIMSRSILFFTTTRPIMIKPRRGKIFATGIYIHFTNAFDKCDYKVIAHKINTKGITGILGWYINYFLKEIPKSNS